MQLFPNFHSLQPSADLDFQAIADIIKSDAALKSSTNWFRELTATNHPKEAKQRKEDTPQVAVAFRMEGGKGVENCRECQYYTFVDFDDKDSKRQLSTAKLDQTFHILSHNYHGILGYKSISGRGYHLIVAYKLPDGIAIDMAADPARAAEIYKRVHRYINRYYCGLTGQKMDEQCGNANRLVGLAHDPDVVFRPDAAPFNISLHDLEMDENGNLIECKKRSKNAKAKGISAEGNFEKAVKMLQKDGREFVQGQRHDFLVHLSFILNKMGVNREEAEQAIDDAFAKDYTEETPSKVLRNCYSHAQDEFGSWTRNKDQSKVTKAELIANFIKGKKLRYDIISRKIQGCIDDDDSPEVRLWKELQERDVNDLIYSCNKSTGENINAHTFRTILNSNIIPAVNPLIEYLKSLSEWDEAQPDFIDEVAQTVHVKPNGDNAPVIEYETLWRACFKKWFVAMVASWMYEDVVNHQVIVLIGEQGIYKTTWLDKLMPPELAQYRSKQTMMERLDKDEQLRAAEYALINLDEIDKLSERGLNELKSMITTTQIDVRAPYGYGKEKRTRIASYVASGNKEQFLTDQTGNRRWLPFLVESIDSPYDKVLPYSGMYAEAVHLIKQGFNYWFSLEETQLMSPHVDTFMVETNEEQLLPVYFSPAKRGSQDAICLSVAEISAKLTTFGNIRKPLGIRQLGALLKKLGYEQVRDATNGRRGYIVIEYPAELVNAKRRILSI